MSRVQGLGQGPNLMDAPDTARVFCSNCGAEIPPWYKDGADSDEAYEKWLDSPCPECGRTPREMGTR